MSKPILCVDDDTNLLEGMVRQFRGVFDITTSTSGEDALALVGRSSDFGVIVSDLRMPGMDGIAFLHRCHEISPDSTRILLTGDADLQAAITSINEGSIFRFLTKPCPPESLSAAIQAGLELNRLVSVEHELLRDTLTGSIRMLSEVLAKVQPLAFGRGSRIRRFAKHIAVHIGLADPWQYELGALLSQVGCMMLPAHVMEAMYNPDSLSLNDRNLLASHPEKGARLIEHIPRMENIAAMIRNQNSTIPATSQNSATQLDPAAVGAGILRLCLDLDHLTSQGLSLRVALRWMHSKEGAYRKEMLSALDQLVQEESPQAPAAAMA